MSNQGLKGAVKEYYLSHNLSPTQIERLQEKSRAQWTWLILPAGMAVSLALALLVFLPKNAIETKVIHEMAYNHNKNLAIEFESQDISLLQQNMAKLDFTIILSNRLPSDQWQILGSRYCSVQGQIAAQIKIKNIRSGAVHTLYQTKLFKSSQTIEAQDYVDGVKVQIWQEKGLLLGISESHAE